MADFSPIPVFVKGEPGFADKLNELGKVLGELVDHVQNTCAAKAPAETPATAKVAPRKPATTK